MTFHVVLSRTRSSFPFYVENRLANRNEAGFPQEPGTAGVAATGSPPAGRPLHGAPRPSRRIGFVPPSGGGAILPRPGRGAEPGFQIH